MVSPDYMLERPPGPSAAKVFLDQRVIPAAIDIAGECEVALRRVSVRMGVGVPLLLVGAVGLLAAVAWQIGRAPVSARRRTG